MSAHMKQRHTKAEKALVYTVTIEIPGKGRRRAFVPAQYFDKLETFLEKYGKDESESMAWDELATDRISKYKKAGLILRGARYREGISQKELAARSGINQENISKMENGLRPIGPAVAKKLAKALHFSEELLFDS